MYTIVQKYGGATLATPEKIKNVAKRIDELHKKNVRVVVVVSAMGQTTNDLIQLAQKVSTRPQLRELDMLLTVGERISMSLLSMALNDLGCPAISFTGSQAGIMTDESHVNAKIIDVKGFRVEEALKNNKVVIMAGFQGVSPTTKEITTLGRGGSDISAVAMAGFLKADQCEILKDVDGIYTADPKLVTDAKLIPQLTLDALLEMTYWGAKVLNSQSVMMAAQKNVKIFVGPADNDRRFNRKNEIIGTIAIPENTTDPAVEFTPIAINSFKQILKLKLAVSTEMFLAELIKNNISKPQILFQNHEYTYVSGADEVNQSIIHFSEFYDFYKLVDKDLSSVSITYNQFTDDKTKHMIMKSIEAQNEAPEIIFNLFRSVHLFVKQNKKDQILNQLHKKLFIDK